MRPRRIPACDSIGMLPSVGEVRTTSKAPRRVCRLHPGAAGAYTGIAHPARSVLTADDATPSDRERVSTPSPPTTHTRV